MDTSVPGWAEQNRGPTVLTVTILMLCLSTASVVLRMISRIGIVRRVSQDDYAIILAWFIALGFSISICYGTTVGLGRHEAVLPPDDRTPLKKAEYVFSVLYNPALMATKTSICLFYLTLAKNQPIFKWLTIGTMGVVNIAGLALTILNIIQCRPFSATFLDPTPASAHCTDIVTLYLSSAPVNIITDLALLFLPMPILTGMRLPRNEKIIVIITFSFGGFVAVVDVVRIAYLESAASARLEATTTGQGMTTYGDFPWIASLSFMWSAIEVHVGMICACVPGVKPLVAKVAPSLLGRIKGAGSDSRNSRTFYGAGDAQWAHWMPNPWQSNHSGPRSPTAPATAVSNPLRLRQPPPDTPPESPSTSRTLNAGQPGSASSTRSPTADQQQREMDMLDFLTTPDMPTSPTKRHSEAGTLYEPTVASTNRRPSITMLDFVNMKNARSLVKLTNQESFLPNALVTILFFMWGFAYGLLDVLNQQFQTVVNITGGQAIGLHSAYYGAYFVAPLTFGGWVFRKWGFRFTFIVGLCVYGVGTLVFWPSAVLASFPAFLISNFIIGLGVATLETAGNPFIALCGPAEYAEVRLNISQGVQAIGSVVSPLLAKKVLFRSVHDTNSLIDVQWAYLGITLFDIILALIFYYLPIPEASDEEMEAEAEKRRAINQRPVLGLPVVFTTLIIGVFSQFCYVGGQEAVSVFFQPYVAAVVPHSNISPFDYQAVGHTVFAVGRFLTALLGLWIKPRHLLAGLYAGVIITSALAMSFNGYSGVALILLILFFESGIFSLIFAIALRGLGGHTKWGSAFMAAGISGGAVVPGIMSPVKGSNGVQYAMCVVVAVFAFGAVMPMYLEGVPAAKRQVDPVRRKGRQHSVLGPGDAAEDKKRSRLRNLFRRRGRKNETSTASTAVAPPATLREEPAGEADSSKEEQRSDATSGATATPEEIEHVDDAKTEDGRV